MNGLAGKADSAYTVSDLKLSDQCRWDDFVDQNGGSFFHLSGWARIISETLGHPVRFLMCEKLGEIVGILPLAHVKSWLFGNTVVSLPFLVYGGPVSTDLHAESLLLDAAKSFAEDVHADGLELRLKFPSGRNWLRKDTHATFRREIHPDSESNLKAIPRKQRAMVRKGIKAGLVAELDDDVERLYSALLPCKRNLGTPFFGKQYLQTIKDEFRDQAEILIVKKDREIVAGVMSFRFRNEILPYYGGGDTIARDLYGNDFMYWSVMEKARTDGIQIFDFGRSMIGSGAYRFKKHWGFEPSPLAYEYLPIASSKIPDISPVNPKYRMLIKAWQRLPLGIVDRIGPPIARRLG